MARQIEMHSHSKIRRVDGATRAALLLLAADRTNAVDLLKRLGSDEVRAIAQGADRLSSTDPALLSDVIMSFEAAFQDGLKFVGTAAEVRNLIVEAIGEESVAATLAGAPVANVYVPPWPELGQVPDEQLRKFIFEQHPQVAALVLTKLDAERVATLLQDADIDRCTDLFTRMLSVAEPPVAVLRAIEEALSAELLQSSGGSAAGVHQGLASILNRLDHERTAQIIGHMATVRPSDAKAVEKMLFRFEDLLTLPQSSLVSVVERIPMDQMVTALQQMPADFVAAVLAVMPARARRMAESELQSGANVNARTIGNARRVIADTILGMASSGAIELSAKTG